MKAMIVKDFRMIARERTIMSAISILVFIASFSSIITFGLLVLYKPDFVSISGVRVGVAGDAPVLKLSGVDVKYDTLEEGLKDFYAGKIDALLYLPEENVSSTNFVTVYLPKDEISGIIATSKVKEILKEYQKRLRKINGIPSSHGFSFYDENFKKIEIKEGSSITFRFIYGVLIPLLLITTAIITGGLVIDLVSEEYETRTYEVILSTPLSPSEFISSKIFVSLLISSILSVIWILLIHLNVGIHNALLILILSISVSMIFSSLGAISTIVLKDRERSQLVFSIMSVSFVTASFSGKSMIGSVTARISAGSYFNAVEFIIYPLIGSILLLMSIFLAKKLEMIE